MRAQSSSNFNETHDGSITVTLVILFLKLKVPLYTEMFECDKAGLCDMPGVGPQATLSRRITLTGKSNLVRVLPSPSVETGINVGDCWN